MRRRSHHRHLHCVALGDDRCLRGSHGIHHGDEIVHPRLDRDVSDNRSGHADAPHVEPEHSRESRQRTHELVEQWLLGDGLDVTSPVVHRHEITRSVADDAICEVGVAATCVLRPYGGHRRG